MVVDSLRQGSAAEDGCGFLGKDELMRSEFNGEGRTRVKLRRIRSLTPHQSSGDFAISSDFDVGSLKKKRYEVAKSIKLMDNEALSSPGGQVFRPYGSLSVIGRRREMEDAVASELGFLSSVGRKYDFFGVYDGHGGAYVAKACREMLHKLVAEAVAEECCDRVVDWEKVMGVGFMRMDEEVNKKGPAVATVGSTAVVAVVGDEEVVVANSGDSRAVICRGGVAVQLSDDHKPDRPDELKRIELSGGKVINWNGHRVLGVLATSRSIGDQYLKPFVVSEPDVKVVKRTEADEFLILASDGLWDVVSNELACMVTKRCFSGKLRRNPSIADDLKNVENSGERAAAGNRASEAAALLVELAIARGSSDNISVTVVELNQKMGECY